MTATAITSTTNSATIPLATSSRVQYPTRESERSHIAYPLGLFDLLGCSIKIFFIVSMSPTQPTAIDHPPIGSRSRPIRFSVSGCVPNIFRAMTRRVRSKTRCSSHGGGMIENATVERCSRKSLEDSDPEPDSNGQQTSHRSFTPPKSNRLLRRRRVDRAPAHRPPISVANISGLIRGEIAEGQTPSAPIRSIVPVSTSIPWPMLASSTSNVAVWWPVGWSVPTPT